MKNCKFLFLVGWSLVISVTPAGAETRFWKRIIALPTESLALSSTGEKLPAASYPEGATVTYLGEPVLITSNGFSSMSTAEGSALYLQSGQKLTVCKNQFVGNRDFAIGDESGTEKLRLHFVIELSRETPAGAHASHQECSCGSCDYKARILSEADASTPAQADLLGCSCEETGPIDPGTQTCVIM